MVGQIFNNTNDGDNCTALFDSTNGNGYNLTINRYDYFVSVYDEAGNLKRLFLNNDGGNVNHFYGFTGFSKVPEIISTWLRIWGILLLLRKFIMILD